MLWIIILSFLSVVLTDSDLRLHWIFVHYHKTGHDLCNYFSEAVFNSSRDKCGGVTRGESHFIGVIDNERKILNTDTSIIRPHHFDWNNVFNIKGHQFRVVHFVREPFDMVISGYLYHRQVPFPAPEPFLGQSTYNPCKYNETALRVLFIPSLTRYMNHTVNIQEMVDGIIHLCEELRSMYSVAPHFNKVLNMAKNGTDVNEGIRFEACRAFLNYRNGDLLRMAYNTLQEKGITSNVLVQRMYTSEFSVTNVDAFHNSTVKLYNFLMSPNVGGSEFYDCFTKEEAVNHAMLSAFKSIPKTYSSHSAKFVNATNLGISRKVDHRAHITADQISTDARANYIKRLEKDPILGPLLLIIREIVLEQ